MVKRALRFAIVTDGTRLPLWQAQCIRDLRKTDGAELVLVIVDNTLPSRAEAVGEVCRPKELPAVQGILWGLFRRMCVQRSCRSMHLVELAEELAAVSRLDAKHCEEGTSCGRLSPEDLDEIRSHDLDFVLSLDRGPICGELLEAARYGVWSFHHGDPDRPSGEPPGFWEIYRGDSVTGAVLQRLTAPPDTGVVLHRGSFRTERYSYAANADSVLLGAADWVVRVCNDIRNGQANFLEAEPVRCRAPVHAVPGNGRMVLFGLRASWEWLREQYTSLFRGQQWHVGIADCPIERFLEPDLVYRVQWLPRQKRGRFLADPFCVRRGDSLTLLMEDLDWRVGKGCIATTTGQVGGTFDDLRVVMRPPYHVSYPYLLEHDGEVYCVPETFEANEVALWRAVAFPDRWEKECTLLQGVGVVDATLFQHEGRWWLLCTTREGEPNTKLFGWYATDLKGPWMPHAANPLKSDVRSSRPAGTPFVHHGVLYRPAQDSSGIYGGSITINRVRELTPTAFQEEPICTVTPEKNGPFPDGVHTLCEAGDVTVVDGARRVFTPSLFWRTMARKLRRIVGG